MASVWSYDALQLSWQSDFLSSIIYISTRKRSIKQKLNCSTENDCVRRERTIEDNLMSLYTGIQMMVLSSFCGPFADISDCVMFIMNLEVAKCPQWVKIKSHE